MNSTNQNKFVRFLRNNSALLLIIFCAIAIATVVIVSRIGDDAKVVVNPSEKTDDGEKTVDPDPVSPVVETVKNYFVAPVDYVAVSMDYTDDQTLFVFNQTLNTWKTHHGVDLQTAEGADVVAIFGGTVIDVSESYAMGNSVSIDHGDGVIATYASLENVAVVKGQVIEKGEKIGEAGTSASNEFLDGAHVHLEIKQADAYVNPMPFVNGEVYREETK